MAGSSDSEDTKLSLSGTFDSAGGKTKNFNLILTLSFEREQQKKKK